MGLKTFQETKGPEIDQCYYSFHTLNSEQNVVLSMPVVVIWGDCFLGGTLTGEMTEL